MDKRETTGEDVSKNTSSASSETIGQMFGRLGGQATSKKHGKAHYIRMQQLSVKKRKKITEFDVTFK